MNEVVAQNIATMRLLGHKWSAIAAVFGYSSGHLTDLMCDHDSVLYQLVTYGTPTTNTDVANAQLDNLALNADGEGIKLAAVKMILDNAPEESTVAPISDDTLKSEILDDLRSK